LIPEKGYYGIPKLYDNGILVAGDAGSLVNSLHREGSNMAMTSGKFAAETLIEASAANDFSKERLSAYQEKLENSFIIKDLKKYRNGTSKFHDNKEKIDNYFNWATDFAYDMISVDGRTKREKQEEAIKKLIKQNGRIGLLKDAYGLRRFFNES
jgi:electron transfer flavoprotein-quinone oxidoreductase